MTSPPSEIRESTASTTPAKPPADLTNTEQPAHENSTTTPPAAIDNPTSTSADGASTEQSTATMPQEVDSSTLPTTEATNDNPPEITPEQLLPADEPDVDDAA